MTDEPTESEVDSDDEQDNLATEIVIAALIAEAFAHPPDPGTSIPLIDQIESILSAVVGPTLRAFVLRNVSRLLTTIRADAAQYETGNVVVPLVTRRVIGDIAASVREILVADQTPKRTYTPSGAEYKDVTEPGGVPRKVLVGREGDLGYTQERGTGSTDVDTYRRIGESLKSASRLTVTQAREEAKLEMAIRLGSSGKVWHTRRDGRVRTSHGDLEGEFRPIGEAFVTIRGARLQQPGDTTAPLAETINCRCRLSYRMKVNP